jgi:hypothetical protein
VALSVPFAPKAYGTFPLGSTTLCVARTFLCFCIGNSDKTACTAEDKDTKKRETEGQTETERNDEGTVYCF